ncbi:circadian clock KaiB family protein [Methylocystis bryophila]|uniref:KaiB domain-containing protein n=1 Tax=Methylocystis bryophila TaxID=655015 RepID=A0A1W6MV32_9HYPH|nr:circadian clock KaiB family protein [Methylocystis bryophila]ARN81445.1 hypothetical protein B1812_10595 [Methylocystis bryophila]BDV37452.1 KaiB 1 protein [Methylocystis bryophila]
MDAALKEHVNLRLFISGATAGSMRAVSAVRRLCEERLAGRFSLEVTDIYQEPEAARRYQLVALPALVKLAPAPKRLFIGNMTETGRLVAELDALV